MGDSDYLWIPVATLVTWSGCLMIGGLGFLLPYDHPRPPAATPEPVQAEVLNVELTHDPLPPITSAPAASASLPPPLATLVVPPSAPPLTAVAEPSPAVAFALPVSGPVQIVDAAQASAAQSEGTATQTAATTATATSSSGIENLTYGRGDGRQPAPEYPRQARQSGQQGAVGVQFRVGPDGRVLEAEATEPSPWPLLNAAAVRAVKERWRFRPGPPRLYLVSIRFQLQN